jgi:hypothetical protein
MSTDNNEDPQQAQYLMPWFHQCCAKAMGLIVTDDDDDDDDEYEWEEEEDGIDDGDIDVQFEMEVVDLTEDMILYEDPGGGGGDNNDNIDHGIMMVDYRHTHQYYGDGHDEEEDDKGYCGEEKKQRTGEYDTGFTPAHRVSSKDPWLATAYELRIAIQHMAHLLDTQGGAYADLDDFFSSQ